jgi:hypothetical protein
MRRTRAVLEVVPRDRILAVIDSVFASSIDPGVINPYGTYAE